MSSNPPTLDDNGTQSAAATPAVDIPGAFPPEEESLYPQTQSQAKPPLERTTSGDGVKDKVHHTAENYIAPERLDQAEHFVEGVGSKAAQYVPAGVANVVSSYWYGSSKSNTSARADSGANGNGTTALPTAEKDSSADEAGVATLSDDPSDNITAAASTATASSAAATDKGASSKNIAGITAADTSISGESSSTTGTLDGSAGSVKATPTSSSTSTATAKLPAVEDAPTKTSAPAPTPAPVPVSEVPLTSEPIATQPAEASTTPSSTDAVTSAAAAAPQEQAIEISKDTISPQDANEIPEGKDDGAKKDDEKAATAVASAAAAAPQERAIETSKDTIPPQDANAIPKGKDDGAKKDDEKAAAGVGAGLAGLGAGVAAMGLGDKDKKDDEVSQPVANLTPRRYALGSLPPVDHGDAASASEDSSVGRVDGARGAWDVAENRVIENTKVENTGPPPKAAEDGIVGNSGGDNGDTKMDDDTNRKYADRISGLQALVQDGVAHDTSAKARVDDVFAPAPAAPSEDSAKPKDLRSDRGYHPAQLHPYTPNASSTASGITSASSSPRHPSLTRNTSPSTSTKDKHGHVHQRTVSTSSVGSGSPRRKKVGFFDKVRGEAKVIVGKIEHKKEKVEEGKRILHGED